MRGRKGKGKEQDKKKREVRATQTPQTQSNNLFNPPVSCQGTSSTLEYVSVLIKKHVSHRGGGKPEKHVEICGQNL